MLANVREEAIFALLEKKFADDSSLGINEQFELRLELYQLSADDLSAAVGKEGFADLDHLLSLYGRKGKYSEPEPKEIEFISILKHLSETQLAGIVNCGDLKTIHDHLYDFYISDDSAATYREYFDERLSLLLESHGKSEEVFKGLTRLEFKDSTASSLMELIQVEPDARESCVDFVWDEEMILDGLDLSCDFMIFALKKISFDHAKLTKRLSKTLLNSIDPARRLINDFSR